MSDDKCEFTLQGVEAERPITPVGKVVKRALWLTFQKDPSLGNETDLVKEAYKIFKTEGRTQVVRIQVARKVSEALDKMASKTRSVKRDKPRVKPRDKQ